MQTLPQGKIYPIPKVRRSKQRVGGKFRRKYAAFFNFQKNWQGLFRRIRRQLVPRYAKRAVILLILVSLIYLLFFSPVFRLEEIEVKIYPAAEALEQEAIRQEIIKELGSRNLILIRESALSFLKRDVTLGKVAFQKNWPNRLKVRLEKRVARAVLEDSAGRLFLVDREGVVFTRAQEVLLPVIHYSGAELSIGDRVGDKQVNFILFVLERLAEANISTEDVQAGTDFRLQITNGPEVVLELGDKSSVESLIKIVEEYESREEVLKRVDLRYKNPVVECQPSGLEATSGSSLRE